MLGVANLKYCPQSGLWCVVGNTRRVITKVL